MLSEFFDSLSVEIDCRDLLSIYKVRRLFKSSNFIFTFVNKRVAVELFTNPQAVVNSDLHLKVVKFLKKLKLQKLILSTVNDKFGFFNAFFNPTWYLVARNSIVSIERTPQERTLALHEK